MSEYTDASMGRPEGHSNQLEEARAAQMFITSMLLGGAIGLILGHHLFVAEERNNNQRDLATAAGYQRCLNYEATRLQPGDTTVTLHLSDLSGQLQEDCGFDTLAYDLKASDYKNDGGYAGGKVTTLDATVALPTPRELINATDKEERASAYSHVVVDANTAASGFFGILAGLALPPVTFNVAQKGRRHFKRR